MGLITRPEKATSSPGSTQYAPATVPVAAEWNGDINTLYTEFNGLISGPNFAEAGLDLTASDFTGTLAIANGGLGNTSGVKSWGFKEVGQTIPLSTTNYVGLFALSTSYSATEALSSFPMPGAGTVSRLYVVTTTSQSGTGSLVLTVRKNGVASALTVTIAAGGAAATTSDTTNSEVFAAGDLFSISIVNNATAASALIAGICVQIVPS